MSLIINDNFNLRAPKPLDVRYSKTGTPYTNEAEAHSLITYKYIGLPMIIGGSSDFQLYWYKGGTAQSNIVPVVEVTPSDIVDLQASIDGKQVSLGFTPVPDTRQINSHPLTSNITIIKSDIGLSNVPNVDATQASNLLSGSIPSARYGATTIPTSAISASGGSSGDFLTKGGIWKQPDAQNYYFSNKFTGDGSSGTPIDLIGSAVTLTTTSNGGAATLISGVLNIPIYSTNGDNFPTNQVHTSGATVTVTNQTTDKIWLTVNPSSLLASLTITLPAVPINGQLVEVSFGGTMTSGAVITSLTISPNSGQTIVQASAPTTANAGDTLSYRYKTSVAIWYRIK